MKTENVEFRSDGVTLRGYFRTPDEAAGTPLPTLVQGPGWLGLASAKNYARWHEGMTDAGYAVFVFDYRGFGDSDGERGWIRPDWQLDDLINAVTYLTTRPDVDKDRIASYGMGGTGGGNAVLLAATDERVKVVAAQSVVADGADWLHRMRREYEWVAYLEELESDAQDWVTEGTGRMVHPREGLMVETPERRATNLKKDVDERMPTEFYLRSASYIMRYRPIDVVHRISPRALLLTAVERDVVTPPDHARRLFEAAGSPKKLVVQRDTTHYRAYTDNYQELLREIVAWYDLHLDYASLRSTEQVPTARNAWIRKEEMA